jgi:predicted glycosyltransferase
MAGVRDSRRSVAAMEPMNLTDASDRMQQAFDRLHHARILMYSHDTFGLGHLRRCRAIAHALVERFKGLQVLIVSGSSIAGAFEFRTRVDFLKIPSIIKLFNGEYTPLAQHTDLHETLALRRSIIQSTAESFELKSRGTMLVLGLRDVMDSPRHLEVEWARADVLRRMDKIYDAVWVYGPADFYHPLAGLDVPPTLEARLQWTGFLRRDVPSLPTHAGGALPSNALLVTAGGGGDGGDLMHQVIAAFEHDATLRGPIVMVLGPFMKAEERDDLYRRAAFHPGLHVLDFDNRPETLIEAAAGVVSMGGYNTFCEILSLDKRALIVPRIHPREEQLIRARRAAELGLIDMILPHEAQDPARLAGALHRLASRPRPSETVYGRPLGGLDRIGDLVQGYFASRALPRLVLLAGGRGEA